MLPAIRVEDLGKQYAIGAEAESGQTFREMLVGAVKAPFRRWARLGGSIAPEEQFWALEGISFEVKVGEALGIIGRNGAGKSTLLKILSRITEPSRGRAVIRGRVSSLLEVGTGFHPELTGRENIMLNGAILGMSRGEILRKFDEIVAFAEIAKFLETPVKRYSSGMYVRLAFAVAAHLEPDILIVDEVLAVGDAEFQKRCLGKMEGVAKEGKTVLFVSHSMPAITRLCSRALLLDAGRIAMEGDPAAVTARYLGSDIDAAAERTWARDRAPGDDAARLKAVRVLVDGRLASVVDVRREVMLEIEYWSLRDDVALMPAFAFYNDEGVLLFVAADFADETRLSARAGLYRARCVIPGNLFSEGQVRVMAEVSARRPVYHLHALVHDSVAFQVVDRGESGSVRSGWGRPIPGALRPQLAWSGERVGDSA
jgi:lipopolysaccharide transport system ATP-binding protein